jgi:membrane-bound lytic murein transglycosylase D
MKKLFSFTLILLSAITIFAQQASIPDAPRKIEFAGVNIKMDAAAQQLVQTEIKALLLPENKYLFDKLARMQWYFPIVEKILEDEEVPEDFKYLAVLESSLNANATSTSNAVGFWQMKEETAKELGLRIDNQVDERKNIQASTRAAALYLKRNNLIYKNWISTLYSYYLGATGVSKSVPANWTFASEISLDASTDRYIIKTIAHRVAYEHRLNRLRESPYSIVEYKTKGKSLNEISNEVKWDINELKRYNAWLIDSSIPKDKDYIVSIFVPIDQYEDMLAKVNRSGKGNNSAGSESGFPVLKRLTLPNSDENSPVFYEINGIKGILASAGDDIGQLALKGKVKPTDLLKFNDMSEKDLVEEGKFYYLKSKSKKAKIPLHTVSENQSLWDISQMYGVRLKQLLKYNRLESVKRLQSGRVVYLQKKRPKNKPIEYIEEKTETENKKESSKPVKDSRKETTINGEVVPADKPLVYEETSKNGSKNNKQEEESIVKIQPQEMPKEEKEEELVIVNTSEETKTQPNVILTEEPVIVNTPPKKNTPTNLPKTNPNPPAETKPKVVEKPIETKPTPISTNTYEVTQGETLFSIARKFNIYVRDLATWNNLTLEDKVRIGQVLTLKNPNSESKIVETKKIEPPKPAPVETPKTHLVVKGETMFSISKKYGVTMKQIQEWNGMTDNNVKLGQKLKIAPNH